MTGRIRVLVSLTVLVLGGIRCRTIRHAARAGLQAAARQHGDASPDRTARDRQPPPAVPDRLARERPAASACAADPDRARSSRGSREVARCTRGDPSRLRHAFPRSTKRRHERLLLPRRAPRGAARANDLRLHATEGAHLRQRSRQAARPRRRDVEHARRRGRADTRRADPSLALAHRLQGREEAGAEASCERRLPSGLTTPAGRERDAPRLVHRRSAERVRDHRSEAGAVRGGTSAPRLLSTAVAGPPALTCLSDVVGCDRGGLSAPGESGAGKETDDVRTTTHIAIPLLVAGTVLLAAATVGAATITGTAGNDTLRGDREGGQAQRQGRKRQALRRRRQRRARRRRRQRPPRRGAWRRPALVRNRHRTRREETPRTRSPATARR